MIGFGEKRLNSATKKIATAIGVSLFFASSAGATTLYCGSKTVTLSGNTVVKIIHEDGTVHDGASISKWWSYDGKAIMHSRLQERLLCSTKAKSRNEIIEELSGRFSKNPKVHGMTAQEAKLMGQYTAMLMRQESSCHLLVDASKSTQRQGMFFIDCNDQQAKTKRIWISESDLKQGVVKQAAAPISTSKAISICNDALKSRTKNKSTYDPALTLGTVSRTVERTGRNVVEIDFKAANSYGVVGKYVGSCILESGSLMEVTINER